MEIVFGFILITAAIFAILEGYQSWLSNKRAEIDAEIQESKEREQLLKTMRTHGVQVIEIKEKEALKQKLDHAIKTENYEEASRLRDLIEKGGCDD